MSLGVRRLCSLLPGLLGLAALLGCDHEMQDQPRYDALETGPLFEDGMADRRPVPGTVPRGHLGGDELLVTGMLDGRPADVVPFAITAEVLERGRERYDIFCAVCHDRAGTGRGIVVRRGFQQPPSLHEERLREVPLGHFVDVMRRGFGVMPPYSQQLPPRDRWAVAAYMRALQLSQGAVIEDLPEEDRRRLAGEGR